MTVRIKITLLITAAGFFSSLVFSSIVLWEGLEQPVRIIDSELDTVSQRTVALISKQETNKESEGSFLNMPLFMGDDRYWLKVYNPNNGQLIYQSSLGKLINIIEPTNGSSATVSLIIPKESVNLKQDRKNEVTFRVKKSIISIDGKSFIVCAARPMEQLEEEFWDIILSVISGLIFSVLVLLSISYFVAGLILK
ncbi:MAG: hypothetical protein KAR45_08745, partial [Desulfobacteraceae bacterium]|nr:hypothetical protein [Desulfobacteraceae bacterium]